MKRFIITEDEKKHISNLYEQSVKRDTKEGVEAEHIYSAQEFIKMFPNKKGTFEVVNGGNIRMNYKNEEGEDTYLEIR